MSNLISKQGLSNLLVVAQDEDFITMEEYEKFLELVDRLPSAIIRCKECKHWNRGRCWGIPFSGDDASYIETEANDFCSYGERRTDE